MQSNNRALPAPLPQDVPSRSLQQLVNDRWHFFKRRVRHQQGKVRFLKAGTARNGDARSALPSAASRPRFSHEEGAVPGPGARSTGTFIYCFSASGFVNFPTSRALAPLAATSRRSEGRARLGAGAGGGTGELGGGSPGAEPGPPPQSPRRDGEGGPRRERLPAAGRGLQATRRWGSRCSGLGGERVCERCPRGGGRAVRRARRGFTVIKCASACTRTGTPLACVPAQACARGWEAHPCTLRPSKHRAEPRGASAGNGRFFFPQKVVIPSRAGLRCRERPGCAGRPGRAARTRAPRRHRGHPVAGPGAGCCVGAIRGTRGRWCGGTRAHRWRCRFCYQYARVCKYTRTLLPVFAWKERAVLLKRHPPASSGSITSVI